MRHRIIRRAGSAISVLLLSAGQSLLANYIYDNSVNDLLTRFDPGTLEVGDEIILAGTNRELLSFSFEFWGTNTTGATTYSGKPQARVRFYLNDGPLTNGYATPHTVFYDSSWISIVPPDKSTSPRATLILSGTDFTTEAAMPLVNPMPVVSNFTWSVEFTSLGLTDMVGLDIYSPPVVGQDYADYWEHTIMGWTLKTNSVPMDFAARLDAVPEPSAAFLAVLGGLGILIILRRRS
jgi:hypothetical protein